MEKTILKIFLFFILNTLLYSDTTAKEEDSSYNFSSLHDDIIENYYNLLKKVDNTLCADEDVNNTKLEKIIYKNNLELITSFQYHEKDGFIPNLYIRANIILPKTNKRFEFTINKQTDSKLFNQKLDTQYHTVEDEKLHFGLKYNVVKENYFNFYAKLGTRVNNPKDIYAKLKMIKYINFHDFMFFWDAQLYRYLLDDRVIASSSINFIKPLARELVLEDNCIITWKQKEETTDLDFITKLYHYIDKKSSMEYRLSYTAEDNLYCHYGPKEYDAHIRYRYMLKKWVYVELSPQLSKKKENNFALERTITLNFALLFSK